jgi:hypothetical protein
MAHERSSVPHGAGSRAVAATLLAGLLMATSALRAQWIDYPTAGVPRKADGTPNLDAPAPRTPDGKPDLSGVWEPERNLPCPPDGCPDNPMGRQFLDIGWNVPGGLPYRPEAAALVKARSDVNGKDDPTSACLPGSIIKMHTGPFFNKYIQTPGLLVILNEREVTYRQIFTDGRPLPEDPQPTWKGYSIGSWEGDTLVVRSNGFRDGIWLDRKGSPLSEGATMIERFHRPNFGRLQIDITVDDPANYTRPWTIHLNDHFALDTELMDFVCLENNKDAAHMVGM